MQLFFFNLWNSYFTDTDLLDLFYRLFSHNVQLLLLYSDRNPSLIANDATSPFRKFTVKYFRYTKKYKIKLNKHLCIYYPA